MTKNKQEIHSKFGEVIKDNDLFGHVVNLNFNKKGDSHNTILGGVFSIAIKLFMVVYIPLIVKKMILSEGNESIWEEFLIDKSDIQPIMPYKDSKFMIGHTLNKVRNGI